MLRTHCRHGNSRASRVNCRSRGPAADCPPSMCSGSMRGPAPKNARRSVCTSEAFAVANTSGLRWPCYRSCECCSGGNIRSDFRDTKTKVDLGASDEVVPHTEIGLPVSFHQTYRGSGGCVAKVLSAAIAADSPRRSTLIILPCTTSNFRSTCRSASHSRGLNVHPLGRGYEGGNGDAESHAAQPVFGGICD